MHVTTAARINQVEAWNGLLPRAGGVSPERVRLRPQGDARDGERAPAPRRPHPEPRRRHGRGGRRDREAHRDGHFAY
jgi:hypothetical protein